MFNYYSYTDEISNTAKKQRARETRKDVIATAQKWRNDSEGSADCFSTTMDSIFEAYNEYKTCECY